MVFKLSDTQIDNLQYKIGEGIDQKLVDLTVGSKQLVHIVKAFYIYVKNEGVNIDTTWCAISGDVFDKYLLDVFDPDQSYTLASTHSSSNTDTSKSHVSDKAITPQQYSAAERFYRSVKRDSTLFSDLQTIVHWDSWSQMFVTKVKVQG